MLTVALVVLALYALLCAVIAWLEPRLVWFPGPVPVRTPRDAGLDFEDLRLTTRDGETLRAWLVHAASARGAVVLSHGNAGNVENRIGRAGELVRMGFDVLLYDYRGYGGSSGSPSEEGTYLDAEAAYDALAARGFEAARIVSFGESLGGAVAIELAIRRRVGALVVEDTFTSLRDMAARLYPWLPGRWLVRVRYASIDKIGAIAGPVLVIHSRDDDLVPFEHGERLFAAAREPKGLVATRGGHNAGGFTTSAQSIAALRAFLESAIPPR